MARHTITVDELDKWLRSPQWQSFASSGGLGSHKKLEVDQTPDGPVFRVQDHGEIKFLGADMAAAISAYNKAP